MSVLTLVEGSPPLRDYVTNTFPIMQWKPFVAQLPSFPFQTKFQMGPPTDRKAILEQLRRSIKDGNIIVGAGAGIGLSAKFIEQGGGDMIIIYNSGRFRMAGRGSLAGLMPYGNANDVVLDMVCTPCWNGMAIE